MIDQATSSALPPIVLAKVEAELQTLPSSTCPLQLLSLLSHISVFPGFILESASLQSPAVADETYSSDGFVQETFVVPSVYPSLSASLNHTGHAPISFPPSSFLHPTDDNPKNTAMLNK
jgi:hypothetical protein